eukprot:m.253519 g.253519  ORF g.253519 m.253519 type:complete len:77 (+) comp40370_c0_seq56:132-362(+)
MVLESFKIMDYSMLVVAHNVDQASRDALKNSKPLSSSSQLLFNTSPLPESREASPRKEKGSPQPAQTHNQTSRPSY